MYVLCVYARGVCDIYMWCVCMYVVCVIYVCAVYMYVVCVCDEGRKASGRRPPAGIPGTGDVGPQKVMTVKME